MASPLSKAERQEQILDAADRLFSRLGVQKTNIGDIALATGMSPAHIYNFFPSKAAVFDAAGNRHMGRLRQKILDDAATVDAQANDSHWQCICRMLGIVAWELQSRLPEVTAVLEYAVHRRGTQPDFFLNFQNFVLRRIEHLLEGGVGTGEFLPMEPPIVAQAIFDALPLSLDPLTVAPFAPDRWQEQRRRLDAQLDLLHRALT